MIKSLNLITLAENTAGGRDLLGEHGIAFLVEADGFRLLFDTGQGLVLQHNAERLGVDLGRLDAIALSHGHYDHTGGLAGVLEKNGAIDLYLHPAALEPKFNRDGKDIGSRDLDREILENRSRRLVWTEQPTEIIPGLWLTGQIPRRTDFEDTGGPFYQDSQRQQEDLIPDDQALFAHTPEGIVVIFGCGHSGLVNTLNYISELTGGEPVRAVFGGLHLLRAGDDRLNYSANTLEVMDVRTIGANHCTGQKALTYLWNRFPDRCVECKAGSRFSFGERA